MYISPVIEHVDEVERPMDNDAGMALDAVCPVFVVVYLVGVECQGREAE